MTARRFGYDPYTDLSVTEFGAVADGVQNGDTGAWEGTNNILAFQRCEEVAHALGRRRYVPPLGHYVIGDPADGTAAASRIVQAARSNVFWHGGGDRSIIVPRNTLVNGLWAYLGTRDAVDDYDIILTANASFGERTITVNDTSGLSENQHIVIKDRSQQLVSANGDDQGYVGENNTIKSIDSATEVTLWGALQFDYTADVAGSGASIHRYTNPCENIRFRDLAFQFDATLDYATTAQAINIQNVIDPQIVDLLFIEPRMRQINLFNCVGGDIRRNRSLWGLETLPSGLNPYFIVIGGSSERVRIVGNSMRNGRHLTDGDGGVNEILNAQCIVAHNTAVNPIGAAFNTHFGTRGWIYDGNQVIGGGGDENASTATTGNAAMQLRGINHHAVNNLFRGRHTGIIAADGFGSVIQGNRIEDCRIAVRVFRSNQAKVIDNRIYGAKDYGVLVEVNNANYDAIEVLRNTITGDPSVAGVDFTLTGTAAWRDDWSVQDNDIPDAATPYSASIPASALYKRLPHGALMTLPTADPAVEGALWNDSGTVKVSAG